MTPPCLKHQKGFLLLLRFKKKKINIKNKALHVQAPTFLSISACFNIPLPLPTSASSAPAFLLLASVQGLLASDSHTLQALALLRRLLLLLLLSHVSRV